jgi:hypothetical protein
MSQFPQYVPPNSNPWAPSQQQQPHQQQPEFYVPQQVCGLDRAKGLVYQTLTRSLKCEGPVIILFWGPCCG